LHGLIGAAERNSRGRIRGFMILRSVSGDELFRKKEAFKVARRKMSPVIREDSFLSLEERLPMALLQRLDTPAGSKTAGLQPLCLLASRRD
jgi:hypothetical protein